MASITTMTPKEQYESSLQSILQIVMDMPEVSDGDWKAISDHTSVLWKLKDRLASVQQQVVYIRANRYYRERVAQTPKTMMLTAQDKATDNDYIPCVCCKRIVKKSYLKTHCEESKVCMDIRLALVMDKRCLTSKVPWKGNIKKFFDKYRKNYLLIHYFVKEHITNKGVMDVIRRRLADQARRPAEQFQEITTNYGMWNYYNR